MSDYKKPLPQVNGDTEGFWAGCRERQLRFQKCCGCDHIRWPASHICPKCHSRNTTWIISAGRGKVYTFVVYHVALHPAFEKEVPYVVAAVDLEEGPRLITNIVGCRPKEVRCDMEVEVTWEKVTGEITLPKFRPASCLI